jgi:hypothetical protein
MRYTANARAKPSISLTPPPVKHEVPGLAFGFGLARAASSLLLDGLPWL